eukprot:Blabericola_migrator_1__821@NODE_1201_length_5128_cov_115_219917_g813_i0_p3_GENE_NODE_1201_length_5128_cov_115_219917_g813_i0NODE_1201_length_5128_cov_115_219917_g813_i0_p3_ORF_typecomplete_len111_score2_36_NODE_1201_length_5128_cov_115_219917_g813_i033333665
MLSKCEAEKDLNLLLRCWWLYRSLVSSSMGDRKSNSFSSPTSSLHSSTLGQQNFVPNVTIIFVHVVSYTIACLVWTEDVTTRIMNLVGVGLRRDINTVPCEVRLECGQLC